MNTKPLLAFLLLVASVAGAILFLFEPDRVPDIVLNVEKDKGISISQMVGERDYLLIIFLMDGCPISRYSLLQVEPLFRKYRDRVSFTAMLLSDWRGAEQFRQHHNIPFPVYGISGGGDPFAARDLIEVVGKHHGLRKVISGGTVLLLDRELRLHGNLSRDDLRELPDRLAGLVD